jgi:hypothetical protein
MTASDQATIASALRRLREHFHEWSGDYDSEHELIGFAIYEGCAGSEHCGAVLQNAAAFALGKELVERDGYSWVMLKVGDEWRHAVAHPALPEPVDLTTLSAGVWNQERYNERPDPVVIVHDSYERLRAVAG